MTKDEYNRFKSVVSPTFPGYTRPTAQGWPDITKEEENGPGRCDDECGPVIPDAEQRSYGPMASGRSRSSEIPAVVDHQNPYRNIPDEVGDQELLGSAPRAEYAGENRMSAGSTPPKGANDIQIGGNHYKDYDLHCPKCGHRMQHWDISWLLGWDMFMYCITKYLFRWKFKGNGLNDLRKAQHYLQKYIEMLESEARGPGAAP